MREPSASAAAAAEVLRNAGVRWALAGGLAALEYRATPRLTVDVDILAEPAATSLVAAFEAAGYEVTPVADAGEPPYLLIVRGHGDQIDVMLAVVDYQREALDRGAANDHVLTPEDVIVHKLIAWRPRDRDDIASILDTGIELDEAYIAHWAAEWQVLDRWQQALLRR